MARWSCTLTTWALVLRFACGANPHQPLGGYQPVSDVIEFARIALDVKGITNYAHHHDFARAKQIYEVGRNSCVNVTAPRALRSFVDLAVAVGRLRGEAYFDTFTNGTGPPERLGAIPGAGRLGFQPGFWDEFISSALDGSGAFAGKSATSRMVAAKKGILGVITMYVSHLLENAVALAAAGKTNDDGGAPAAWDQAWALYYGACGDEQCVEECVTENWCRFSAWEATRKRDGDHAFGSSFQRIPGTVMASEAITNYFLEGQRASRTATLNITALIQSRDSIYRVFALTAIRATLRYTYAMNRGNALKYYSLNELLHMQAFAYFLTAAGWIEQASPGAARRVLDLIDYRKVTGEVPLSLHCEVKGALIAAYAPLGLDCTKVGQDWAIPSGFQCERLPPCPSEAIMPAGLPGYSPGDTDTVVESHPGCSAGQALRR